MPPSHKWNEPLLAELRPLALHIAWDPKTRTAHLVTTGIRKMCEALARVLESGGTHSEPVDYPSKQYRQGKAVYITVPRTNPLYRSGKHLLKSKEKPEGRSNKVRYFLPGMEKPWREGRRTGWGPDEDEIMDKSKRQAALILAMRNPHHILTREQVITEMKRQDVTGRRGRLSSDDDYLGMVRPGKYRLLRLPVAQLDAVAVQPEKVQQYARSRASYPPVLAYPRKDGTWYVAQGNHRVLASLVRGSREIRAFIPTEQKSAWA